MTAPGPAFQECTGSCHRNVPVPKAESSNLQSTDGLLLADVTLCFEMYPAGKVDISRYLAIPKFSQSDHTVGKPSEDTGSLCSEA